MKNVLFPCVRSPNDMDAVLYAAIAVLHIKGIGPFNGIVVLCVVLVVLDSAIVGGLWPMAQDIVQLVIPATTANSVVGEESVQSADKKLNQTSSESNAGAAHQT